MHRFAGLFSFALILAPHILRAESIAPGLTLDGDVTLEFRHNHYTATAGVRLAPHLRWTSPTGQFGLDVGTEIWREPGNATLGDVTYGSVFLGLAGGELHLGRPRTAVETLLSFPAFSTSSSEAEVAAIYSQSRMRQFQLEGVEEQAGLTWSRNFGHLSVAASYQRWTVPDVAEVIPNAQLALRYDNQGTVLMAGLDVVEKAMPIYGVFGTRGYHLGALQSVGDWRLGALINHFDDATAGTSKMLRLHADYDVTPNLNIGLQYQRLDSFMTIEHIGLNAHYALPDQPLFLEAGFIHGDLTGNVVQTGLGLKF